MNFDLSEVSLGEVLGKVDQLNRQVRIAIFVFIFALTQSAFVGLVWMGQVEKAQRLERKIQTELGKLEKQSEVMEERLALERALRRLRSHVPALIAGFPPQDEVPELLDSVYRRLGSNGLHLVNFKPGKTVKQSELLQIPVSVRLEGASEQVAVIPNLLAGLSRKVNLGDFSIKQLRSEDKSWQFSGQLNAFAQLPDKQLLALEPIEKRMSPRGGGQ